MKILIKYMQKIMKNWRKFIKEDLPGPMTRDDLISSPGTNEMSIQCYIPNKNLSIEAAIKYMIALGYMAENTDIGDPNTACTTEFVRAIQIAQKDLGFTEEDIDGVMGPQTAKRLKLRALGKSTSSTKSSKVEMPGTFTPQMKEHYSKPEVKQKITKQKKNAMAMARSLESKATKRLQGRPEPFIDPSDPVVSQKFDVNIPLLMAFRSVEENPRKGASSFLIMMNLFHSYSKFKYLDDPIIGYKIGDRNRQKILKKLFTKGPAIDGSAQYIRTLTKKNKNPFRKIPHTKTIRHISGDRELLKNIFKRDPLSAIMGTSFGSFQVHPSRRVATTLAKDQDFISTFIMGEVDQATAKRASQKLIEGWLSANKSFRRAVNQGNSQDNYDFSLLASYYNGNNGEDVARVPGNRANFYYGALLAKQYVRAVDNFYGAMEEAPTTTTG